MLQSVSKAITFAGSKSVTVQASALQVALAGLGLDEQQLRRVAAALVTQLQHHTARQQTVSLQVQLVDSFHMPYPPNVSHIHMLFKACTTSKHIGLQQNRLHFVVSQSYV